MSSLSEEQLRRYGRQTILPEIGEPGQQKLLDSHVLVIGAGGLGSAALTYLAAAGIGTITLIDYDRVELSNLNRQIIHETGDIGRAKVESAKDAIEELNPDITLHTIAEKLTEANAVELIADADIVVDSCDNFETRLLVNRMCFEHDTPLISAAVQGWQGQISVFTGSPCYQCLVSDNPENTMGCQENGIVGAMAGIMGSIQALEVIKFLLNQGDALVGKLMLISGLNGKNRVVDIVQDPECQVCSTRSGGR